MGVSHIFILTNQLTNLSLSVRFRRVYVCVLFMYTISISIFCVSLKELYFIDSIQQICDFYK